MRVNVVLLLFLLIQQMANAATPNLENSNLTVDKIAADLEETKQSLVEDELKQRKIMSSLFAINKKMKKIVTERSGLVQERMLVESVSKGLAQTILSVDERLKIQKNFLRQRLSVIYRFGGQGLIRLLFSSRSSAELERNLKIMGVVAKRDLDLIKDYASSVKELESKKFKLQNRLVRLRQLEQKIKDQEKTLTAENAMKYRILDGIRKSKKFMMSRLSGLREKSEHLASGDDSGELDLLFRPSFYEQKGKLPLPVNGKILNGFGLMRDEQYNVTLSHKGVFIGAQKGGPVRSVFSGTVSFVGIIPGFGQTLILDHGDHYYTVYSHNETISVNVGEEIKQSQVVATVGSDPQISKDGLYFEVRHFSEPYDPQAWMKGSL